MTDIDTLCTFRGRKILLRMEEGDDARDETHIRNQFALELIGEKAVMWPPERKHDSAFKQSPMPPVFDPGDVVTRNLMWRGERVDWSNAPLLRSIIAHLLIEQDRARTQHAHDLRMLAPDRSRKS